MTTFYPFKLKTTTISAFFFFKNWIQVVLSLIEHLQFFTNAFIIAPQSKTLFSKQLPRRINFYSVNRKGDIQANFRREFRNKEHLCTLRCCWECQVARFKRNRSYFGQILRFDSNTDIKLESQSFHWKYYLKCDLYNLRWGINGFQTIGSII